MGRGLDDDDDELNYFDQFIDAVIILSLVE